MSDEVGSYARPDLIRLHRIVMPMTGPFVASHGTEAFKHATVVEVVADGISGWGECAALEHPTYTDEFADGAFAVLAARLPPQRLRVRTGAQP